MKLGVPINYTLLNKILLLSKLKAVASLVALPVERLPGFATSISRPTFQKLFGYTNPKPNHHKKYIGRMLK